MPVKKTIRKTSKSKAAIPSKRVKKSPRTKAFGFMKKAKDEFGRELGKLEVRLESTKKKSEKNALRKSIKQLKSTIRKLAI